MTSSAASKAHSEHRARILTMLEGVMAKVGDMIVENVNWGHVGDMARIEQLCRELAQVVGSEDVIND